MMKTILVLTILFASTAQARSPMVPYVPGPLGPGTTDSPMIPSTTGGAAPPPIGCTGAINLASGCAQAMLGGL